MKFTLGRKVEMTSMFDENGYAVAATIIEAMPTTVTDIRTIEKDGYEAVALGYGVRNKKNVAKAQLGSWKDMGVFAEVREFRLKESTDSKVGDKLAADIFTVVDIIDVTGTSKGKGFQGVVKRHNFAGGRRSHGQKHSEREPGSIGATGPQRVFKGTRMGGRMGSDRVCVKNLEVLAVDTDNNVLIVKGAVPGRRGTLVEIVSK